MNISAVAIRNPVFAWMLMAALILFGWISFRGMGVSQLPDVDFPVVNVSITLEGAAPGVIESNIIDPVESAVMSIEGVAAVNSTARAGQGNVSVEFVLSKNIDVAVQEIQTKLGQAQRQLPDNADPAVITKSNPEDRPILFLNVNSDTMSRPELMALVRDRVKDRFLTVPGVSDLFMAGYVDPNVRVWVSRKKLDQYALTVGDAIAAIQQEHSEPPAGRIETPNRELNLRTMGEAESIGELERITIGRRGGAANYVPLPLSAVARVEEGLADVRRITRVITGGGGPGKNAIGLGIRKQRGSNAVEVAHSVRRRMEEIRPTLPKEVSIEPVFDSTQFIEESIHEMNFTLILSAFLTALVCWVFLGSISATINVVLAIPTSIIGSFMVLKALGFTLNTFTLLALSLAIGIVVDDAIMVLENIVRHKEGGKDRVKASLDGAKEIGFAAMAATAAIIAIFLPVAFMTGVIGRYFYQFGVTLSVAVAISLLEALTLTPMRTSRFLSSGHGQGWVGRTLEGAFAAAERAYARVLPPLLAHRWKVVVLACLFCAATFSVVTLLRKELVPPQDQGSMIVRLKTPEGSSLAHTDAKMRQLEKILSARPEVARAMVSTGGFGGGGEVNTGMSFVTLKPLKERGIRPGRKKPLSQQELAQELRGEFKAIQGARVFIQDLSLSGFSAKRGFPVELSLRGPDWDKLAELSKTVIAEMQKTGLVVDVDSDFESSVDEVHVIPDREKARARGVSVAEIGQTISSLLGSTIAGRYMKGGRQYDIRVKLEESEAPRTEDPEAITRAIGSLMVRNNRGELVALSDVTRISRSPGLQAIVRQDRERAISVFANLAKGASQAAALQKSREAAEKVLPQGYRVAQSGSAQTFQESFDSLVFALGLGLVVSYMVLASQFNSFVHPVTVLVALPFSVSGAFVSLWLGNQSLNIYSMIGLILLMGIVKKNSILLVDFTNHKRAEGLGVREALIAACPVRLRPIVMTSFATVAGAIPPALAIGPGAESRIPMALAVVGGVIVSTALTLFVVPCVYSLLARVQRES